MILFRLGLTPNSNVWVGAWWIGFLIAAILCAILALPLLAFPPALPGKYFDCRLTGTFDISNLLHIYVSTT